MVSIKARIFSMFLLLTKVALSTASSACAFLLGKNSVSQGLANSSFPLWHKSRAISSVRSGSSWQMRERDFLPLMRCEMVPYASPTCTMRYIAGTGIPRLATALETSYSCFTTSHVLKRALFTLRISSESADVT